MDRSELRTHAQPIAIEAPARTEGQPADPDDFRWRAVGERDESFDGQFVYAVTSTGVYCRPSCPSRRPKPENVRFFGTPTDAERAGFRACRRCHPEDVGTPRGDYVERARRLIEDSADGRIGLAALAREVGVSPFHLQRTFTRVFGVSPRAYGESVRLARLKDRLREGEDVTAALYGAGYGSSSRLYESASASLGMTPGDYRRGGRGVEVAYAIADSPLGRLLVAATARGVCAAGLADDDASLEAFLRAELPAATLRRDDAAVRPWLDALLDYLAGRSDVSASDSATASPNVPVDVAGTEFQRRVWTALRLIPVGRTVTYAGLARSLGMPTAARAVARACATNPASLVIPCHRVVRGDGGLGGYRWGLERKRALLDAEAKESTQ